MNCSARMRASAVILMVMATFCGGGATCLNRPATTFQQSPVVWNAPVAPALSDVIAAVNRTGAITQLSTNQGFMEVRSMPSLPKLTASIALQRPRQFRLKASPPLMVTDMVDIGSNDQVFWFEVPEGMMMKRTLYFADHESYQHVAQRSVLPIEPMWIADAFGLAEIDPNTVISGPTVRGDGKLEIHCQLVQPAGTMRRVYWIDAALGYVTDQYVYSASGALVAESHSARHEYFDDIGCALPHQVDLILAPVGGPPLSLRIEVGRYMVNQILGGDPNLFVMPQDAAQVVNIAQITNQPMSSAPGVSIEKTVPQDALPAYSAPLQAGTSSRFRPIGQAANSPAVQLGPTHYRNQ